MKILIFFKVTKCESVSSLVALQINIFLINVKCHTKKFSVTFFFLRKESRRPVTVFLQFFSHFFSYHTKSLNFTVNRWDKYVTPKATRPTVEERLAFRYDFHWTKRGGGFVRQLKWHTDSQLISITWGVKYHHFGVWKCHHLGFENTITWGLKIPSLGVWQYHNLGCENIITWGLKRPSLGVWKYHHLGCENIITYDLKMPH